MKQNIEGNPVVKWNWNIFEHHLQNLIDKFDDYELGRIVGVLAIPSGGYIPAVMLSKRLGYKGKIKSIADAYMREGRYLIVDEIADSGETIKMCADRFPNSVFATIVTTGRAKELMRGKPFFYGIEVNRTWVQFPWEIDHEEEVK